MAVVTGTLARLNVDGVTNAINTNLSLFYADGNEYTVDLDVCNTNTVPGVIRVAIVDGAVGDLATEDYKFYDFEIPAAGVGDQNSRGLLYKQAISGTDRFVVRSSITGMVFSLAGSGGLE